MPTRRPSYTVAMDKLAELRKSYERAALDEEASLADPLKQFEAWLNQAIDAKLPEPNANMAQVETIHAENSEKE